jgi:hypothetical protein
MTADDALWELQKWVPTEEDHLLQIVGAELKALREKVANYEKEERT